MEETAIITAVFNDFVQHCFQSAQISSGSECKPASGTPLLPGRSALALGIPIMRHPPLLTLAPVSCMSVHPQRSEEIPTEAMPWLQKAEIFLICLPLILPLDSWPVPNNHTKQWKQRIIINAVSYCYKRDIINWKHKDNFIFINSLKCIWEKSLTFLHLQLFSSCIAEQAVPEFIHLNPLQSSVHTQQKDFIIQWYFLAVLQIFSHLFSQSFLVGEVNYC